MLQASKTPLNAECWRKPAVAQGPESPMQGLSAGLGEKYPAMQNDARMTEWEVQSSLKFKLCWQSWLHLPLCLCIFLNQECCLAAPPYHELGLKEALKSENRRFLSEN